MIDADKLNSDLSEARFSHDVNKDNMEILVQLVLEPRVFIENFLHIQDKEGRMIPFRLNKAQEKFYEEYMRQRRAKVPVRIIVLKARQMGFSTLIAALIYHATIFKKNVNSMVIAHKADASTNIFNKTKLFWEMQPALQPMKKASNAKELIFENPSVKLGDKKNNPGLRSKIEIETAVSRDAGRSATVHNLHLSELGFWPYAKETMAASMQSVPNHKDTFVCIESTAQGVGNTFHLEWERAASGQSQFVPLFFPWFDDPGYSLPVPKDYEINQDEQEIKDLFNLTDEQIVWRRWCIRANCNGDVNTFHQEYPSTPEEAFLSSGRPVFDMVSLEIARQKAKKPLKQGVLEEDTMIKFKTAWNGWVKIWEEPTDDEYVIGIDTAGGGEHGDYSVMKVLNMKTEEFAAEWHGHIDPDLLGDEAVKLGRYYNLAYLIPEINNTGIATMNRLRERRYPRIYRRRSFSDDIEDSSVDKYGFITTIKTKPLLISGFAAFIREHPEKLINPELISECLAYVYDDRGRTNAQSGCYDDRVIAAALCVWYKRERPAGERRDIIEDLSFMYGGVSSTTGY